VLLCGVDPLRIYIFNEGLGRFATDTYCPPMRGNLNNHYMHLTNYAINKNSSNFIYNSDAECDDEGSKRSLVKTLLRIAEELGYDKEGLNKLWSKIVDIIIKTICTVQPSLAHMFKSCQPDDTENSMCFEVLG
jgi:tubulin polyglutamylase TTLL6/13